MGNSQLGSAVYLQTTLEILITGILNSNVFFHYWRNNHHKALVPHLPLYINATTASRSHADIWWCYGLSCVTATPKWHPPLKQLLVNLPPSRCGGCRLRFHSVVLNVSCPGRLPPPCCTASPVKVDTQFINPVSQVLVCVQTESVHSYCLWTGDRSILMICSMECKLNWMLYTGFILAAALNDRFSSFLLFWLEELQY